MGDTGESVDAATPGPGPRSRHEVVPGSLKARLIDDQRAALKGGARIRLSTLRLLSAAVTNREVEVGRSLTDAEFEDVARREVKRRREAADAYAAAGREDRATVERAEQEILEAYLPAGLSDAEIDVLVEEAVATLGASGPGDLGKVMGAVMARAKGRAEGRVVQAKVRSRLQTP